MLVTKTVKTAANISNLSPTPFVANNDVADDTINDTYYHHDRGTLLSQGGFSKLYF